MESSSAHRIFLASAHVGMAASLYLPAREILRPGRNFELDVVFLALLAPIFYFWFRRRNHALEPYDGAVVGLKSIIAATAILTITMLVRGTSNSVIPGSVFAGATTILAISAVVAMIAWIPVIGGGFLTSLLFYGLEQMSRRPSLVLAGIFTILLAVIPITTLVVRLKTGAGLFE